MLVKSLFPAILLALVEFGYVYNLAFNYSNLLLNSEDCYRREEFSLALKIVSAYIRRGVNYVLLWSVMAPCMSTANIPMLDKNECILFS